MLFLYVLQLPQCKQLNVLQGAIHSLIPSGDWEIRKVRSMKHKNLLLSCH